MEIDQDSQLARAAQFATFATLGAIGTTQDIVGDVLGSIEGADADLVAEETLCLIAVTTARAAAVGLQSEKEIADAVLPSLLELPFTYRDYLVAGAILRDEDTSLLDKGEAVYKRLEKKQTFYKTQFREGAFPGEEVLKDKMELWMGRVSPPGLPEAPGERLQKLGLVAPLLTQMKLVLAFGRSAAATAP